MKSLPWWEGVDFGRPTDVERIRNTIDHDLSPGAKILYKCFNRSEADHIRAQLTDQERTVVIFTWSFDDRGAGNCSCGPCRARARRWRGLPRQARGAHFS